MNKNILYGIISWLVPLSLHAQSAGINTTAPDPSSLLDMVSQSKGLLVPRLTKSERDLISSPLNALLIYQTDNTSGFYYYDNNTTSWKQLTGAGTKIQDADGNTQVQTEKNPNENIIRFDLAGTEKMSLFKNPSSVISRMHLVNTQGNIAIGDSVASIYNTAAFKNIAIGLSALKANVSGRENVAIGAQALSSFNESKSIGIGFEALKQTITGDYYNVGIGYKANTLGGGDASVIIGAEATPDMSFFTNIGIGRRTNFLNNGSGSRNILIGAEAMYNATNTSSNTGIGYRAMYNNDFANTPNAYVGAESGHRGQQNIGIGYKTLALNTNNGNAAVGSSALMSHTTGHDNNAIGYNALLNQNTGEQNIAIGSQALYNSPLSTYNIGVGYRALANATGENNVALGFNAQNISNDTASFNVVIGANSQNNAASGDGNIVIGQNAEVAAGVSNSVALGKDAYAALSNTVILGSVEGVNGATTTVQVGLGTSNPHNSAIFEAKSDTRAFEIPYNNLSGMVNPAEGLLSIGNSNDNLMFYNGTEWKDINASDFTNADGANVDETYVFRNGNLIKGYTNSIIDKQGNYTSKATIEETENDNQFRLTLHSTDVVRMGLNTNGQLIFETLNNNKNIYFGAYDTFGGMENTILSTNNNDSYANGNTCAGNYTISDAGDDRVGLGDYNLYSFNTNSPNPQSVAIGFQNGVGMNGEGLTLIGSGSYEQGDLFLNNTTMIGNFNRANGNIDRATSIGREAELNCSDCVVLGVEKNHPADTETEVGIGTTMPTAPLFIEGQSSETNAQLKLEHSSTNNIEIQFYNPVNNRTCMLNANPNSNVNSAEFRLGQTSNGSLMTLMGNGDATLTSLTAPSDSTLKEKIQALTHALEGLKEIHTVSYQWKDEKKQGTHLGVIAQDVEKYFPELVEVNDDGMLSVNYAGLNAVLWQSLKEMKEQIEQNEMQYAKQMQKIIELKKRIKERQENQNANTRTLTQP